MSPPPNLFPMMVKLEGRNCLVVGAGRIAAEKASGLLRHKARVTVVAPRAVEWFRRQARAGRLRWRRRKFAPRDVEGAILVVAATDCREVNREVFEACRAHRILCNSVDDPEHCDFFYPAVVRRGSLQIAISTQGQSPALASRLRQDLQRQFGPEWGPWVGKMGKMRRGILRSAMDPKERRERLLEMAQDRPPRKPRRSSRQPGAKSPSRR